MRTTLDLDDRVLAMARAKAAQEQISLGKAVSALVLLGAQSRVEAADRNGIPVYPAVPGHVIDLDLVNRLRDDDGVDA